ncbi:hypothetical protein DOY81_004736 [Sarcophaga bullata]|nr:hypothetical protein DOY81_004736 [Sarcophaga bullata]
MDSDDSNVVDNDNDDGNLSSLSSSSSNSIPLFNNNALNAIIS